MMALTLAANYLNTNLNSKTKEFEVETAVNEDREKIKLFMTDLFEYLNKTVIPFTKMQQIMENSNRSPQEHMRARFLEPYGFYYNELANSFIERLEYVSKKDKGQSYIPDMLAIFIILDFKNQAGYSFEKYDFIFNAKLEEYAEFYFKFNQEEKKRLGIKSFSVHIQDQPVVRRMSNISLFMIEKLLKSNYSKSTREADNKIKPQRKKLKRNNKR